ncbi:MAG: chorismate mutase [Actinomycetales bacterium]
MSADVNGPAAGPGESPEAAYEAEDPVLAGYRQSIDNIDAALVFMLSERFKITQKVGEYKAATDQPPADPAREARQLARLRELSRTAQLDPEFSEKFLRFVIDEVIHHHERIRDSEAIG